MMAESSSVSAICARRGGDGVGAGRFRLGALGVDDGAIERIALDLLGDAVHGGDRLDRILPGGGFRRQHDRVGAFEDGGRDVRDLGAGRHRARDHRFEHLGRDHDRLAGAARRARHLLLHARHLFERHLDAEVAARHHQRIGEIEDLVEPMHRLRLLDLGHDGGAAARDLLGFGDVLRPLDEGERHPVDAGVERGLEVGAVLLGAAPRTAPWCRAGSRPCGPTACRRPRRG